MARGKGSGGNREGSPGKIAANAAVGGVPGPPPVAAFQGQEWGEQTAQIAMQRAGAAPTPATPPAGRGPIRPTVDLEAPTERPTEPVTAGLPVGAGPGPNPQALGDVLNGLAGTSAEIAELAAFYNSGRR